MSSINPNGQSNNSGGGYHPTKRNPNHRAQQQAAYNPYAGQAGAFVTPESYMGAYQQVYQPYYPQQPFYSPQAGYVNVAPAYSPRSAQDYSAVGQHQLNITTPNGDKVDLRSLNSTYTPKATSATLNRSAATTPKASGATPHTHQRNSSITSNSSSVSASAAPKDPSLDAMKEAFRKQVLERAKKAKESKGAASPAPASASLSTETKKESTPTPKATTPTPASVAASPKPVVSKPAPVSTPAAAAKSKVDEDPEETIRKFKESIAAKTKKAEAKQESSPAPVAEQKAESSKAEEPKVEEPKTESVVEKEQAPINSEQSSAPSSTEKAKVEPAKEEQQEQKQQPASEQKEESQITPSESTELKNITEEPKTEETSSISEEKAEETTSFTISKYFEQIEKAKIIENPFEFKYPEGKIGPDAKLKPTENAQKKYRYDPIFLLQFHEQTQFLVDDQFKEKIKFIQIGDKRNDRSLSKGGPGGQFRSGFGQGSISGIQGSQFSKSGSSRKPMDFTSRSNSRQNSKRRGGSGRNERKSNRNRDRDAEKEPEVPAEPVKPLEKSATRWVPKSRAAKQAEVKYAPDGVTVLLSAEEIERKVKSLLNKLTLEYFEEISADIINIANQSKWEDNAETLKSVLEFTFAKACDEPHWSSMYAQFCAKMCTDMSEEVKDKEVLNKNTNEPEAGGALVRRHLVTRCQLEYTKGWADKLPTNEDGSAIEPEMMSDEYYEAAKAKRRGLGLIRFIGHLYVLGLISDSIILLCLNDQSKNTEDPSEDTVENLIQLIRTVGKKLEFHPSPQVKARFESIFPRIEALSTNSKLPSRLQFKLLDILDLRKAKWAGGEAEAGPKTISEIHEEAEQKAREEEKASKEKRNQGRNDSRSNSSRSNWGGKVSSSDIKNVGVVRNSHSSSNLGPMNNFNRSKSLRSSGRQSSQNAQSEASTPSSPAPSSPSGANSGRQDSKKAEPAGNRFALLNDEEQHNEHSDEEHEQKGESAAAAVAPAATEDEASKEEAPVAETKEVEEKN